MPGRCLRGAGRVWVLILFAAMQGGQSLASVPGYKTAGACKEADTEYARRTVDLRSLTRVICISCSVLRDDITTPDRRSREPSLNDKPRHTENDRAKATAL